MPEAVNGQHQVRQQKEGCADGHQPGLSCGESDPKERLLARGPFGEWTMRKVHGTATFEIRGLDANPNIPKRLPPNQFSPHVGFRCAFTFPGE